LDPKHIEILWEKPGDSTFHCPLLCVNMWTGTSLEARTFPLPVDERTVSSAKVMCN